MSYRNLSRILIKKLLMLFWILSLVIGCSRSRKCSVHNLKLTTKKGFDCGDVSGNIHPSFIGYMSKYAPNAIPPTHSLKQNGYTHNPTSICFCSKCEKVMQEWRENQEVIREQSQ